MRGEIVNRSKVKNMSMQKQCIINRKGVVRAGVTGYNNPSLAGGEYRGKDIISSLWESLPVSGIDFSSGISDKN